MRWPQPYELGMLMVLSLEWLIFFREELRGYLVGGFGGAWAPLDTAPGHVSIGQAGVSGSAFTAQTACTNVYQATTSRVQLPTSEEITRSPGVELTRRSRGSTEGGSIDTKCHQKSQGILNSRSCLRR